MNELISCLTAAGWRAVFRPYGVLADGIVCDLRRRAMSTDHHIGGISYNRRPAEALANAVGYLLRHSEDYGLTRDQKVAHEDALKALQAAEAVPVVPAPVRPAAVAAREPVPDAGPRHPAGAGRAEHPVQPDAGVPAVQPGAGEPAGAPAGEGP